jgi:threonylcarbamoyladenosine tRNA methylthiotransferase MtaB
LKSVAFHTLGCKLNYSETATLSRTLQADGFIKKDFEEEAAPSLKMPIKNVE